MKLLPIWLPSMPAVQGTTLSRLSIFFVWHFWETFCSFTGLRFFHQESAPSENCRTTGGLSTLYQLSSCREFAWTYFKLLIGEGRWDSAKCQTSARCQCTLHHHYHINDQSQSTIIDRFPGNFVRNPRTPGKMNYWKPGRNLGQIIIYWQLT